MAEDTKALRQKRKAENGAIITPQKKHKYEEEVDVKQSLDALIECPVCYLGMYGAVSLECGHSLCANCVVKLNEEHIEKHNTIGGVKCPECSNESARIRPNWPVRRVFARHNPSREIETAEKTAMTFAAYEFDDWSRKLGGCAVVHPQGDDVRHHYSRWKAFLVEWCKKIDPLMNEPDYDASDAETRQAVLDIAEKHNVTVMLHQMQEGETSPICKVCKSNGLSVLTYSYPYYQRYIPDNPDTAGPTFAELTAFMYSDKS